MRLLSPALLFEPARPEPPPPAAADPVILPPTWLTPKRPPALPAMYVSLGAMQALDIYTTLRAVGAGAREQNPVVARLGGHAAAMAAYKAVTTAGTIFAAERMWKKNRVGAVVVMAIANGVTAAVAARNIHVAKAQRAR